MKGCFSKNIRTLKYSEYIYIYNLIDLLAIIFLHQYKKQNEQERKRAVLAEQDTQSACNYI